MTKENYINEQDKKDGDCIIKTAGILTSRVRKRIAKEFEKSHGFIKSTKTLSIDDEIYNSLVFISFKSQLLGTLLQDEIDNFLKMDAQLSLDNLKDNIKSLWKHQTGKEF